MGLDRRHATHLFNRRLRNRLLVGNHGKRFESGLAQTAGIRLREQLAHPRVVLGARTEAVTARLFHNLERGLDLVQGIVRRNQGVGNGPRIQEITEDFPQLFQGHDIGRRKNNRLDYTGQVFPAFHLGEFRRFLGNIIHILNIFTHTEQDSKKARSKASLKRLELEIQERVVALGKQRQRREHKEP